MAQIELLTEIWTIEGSSQCEFLENYSPFTGGHCVNSSKMLGFHWGILSVNFPKMLGLHLITIKTKSPFRHVSGLMINKTRSHTKEEEQQVVPSKLLGRKRSDFLIGSWACGDAEATNEKSERERTKKRTRKRRTKDKEAATGMGWAGQVQGHHSLLGHLLSLLVQNRSGNQALS